MAKKKYYAVKAGNQTGIFETWEACQAAVKGFSGADFKGFTTLSEAKAYLGDASSEDDGLPWYPDRVVAYVDGSYEHSLGRYAFGCVLMTPEGNIYKVSGSGNDPNSAALRNVTGEMLGAMYAVRWALVNGYKAIDIRYDYTGIEMWATGGWQCKNDLTKKYGRYMMDCGQKISITFRKIAAHTGDMYNEEADQLAKAGLTGPIGIPKVEKIR